MTPRQLNARIKNGETWYCTSTASVNGIVRKAWTYKGKVKIQTDGGVLFAGTVRQCGSSEWVNLFSEGIMTWAIN